MGVFDKSAVRTSLLTIDYPLSRAIEGNVVRTGEALGLVLALGGEGNRLAIMSSKILADIIIHNENLDVYKKRLRRLFRETVKQGFVLKLLSSINDYKAIENAMSNLDVGFYKKFLLGSFNLKKAFLAGLKTRVFLRGSMRLYLEFIARYLSLFI
jgi:flavin-dependent dehydrogenase